MSEEKTRASATLEGRAGLHYGGTGTELLRQYLPYFAACRRVLDYGCGSGNFLQLCKENGISAVGYDPSPRAIEQCRARGLTVSLEPPRLADFDGLLLVCVIEHMPPPEVWKLLSAFCGTVVVQADEPREVWIPWGPQLPCFWDDYEHVRPYTPGALRNMLLSFGYDIVAAGRVRVRVPFRHFRTWLTHKYLDWVAWRGGICSPHFCVGVKRQK